MNFDVISIVIGALNLAAISVTLFVMVKTFRIVKSSSDDKFKHIDHYFNDLLERVQRIERNHPVQAATKAVSIVPEDTVSGSNRLKSAIEKLRAGADPLELKKEHGYSGSEMGLIMAAAALQNSEFDSN